MDWDKHHLSWKENIGNIEVPIKIGKVDMLKAIMSEGDFAFKGINENYVIVNLKNWKLKTKKDMKLLESFLWKEVIDYVNKKQLKELKEKKEQ